MSCVIEFDNNVCIHLGESKRDRKGRIEKKRSLDAKKNLIGNLFWKDFYLHVQSFTVNYSRNKLLNLSKVIWAMDENICSWMRTDSAGHFSWFNGSFGKEN